jgi:hypothetical protein
MGNSRAPPVRVAQQSATLAAWVQCLTKADTRGEDECRGAGLTPAAPGLPETFDRNAYMQTRKHYRHLPEERFKPWQFTDFYQIETLAGTFVVSMGTARHVEHRLETCSDLESIDFHDLSGVRHRIQARYIARITAHD